MTHPSMAQEPPPPVRLTWNWKTTSLTRWMQLGTPSPKTNDRSSTPKAPNVGQTSQDPQSNDPTQLPPTMGPTTPQTPNDQGRSNVWNEDWPSYIGFGILLAIIFGSGVWALLICTTRQVCDEWVSLRPTTPSTWTH